MCIGTIILIIFFFSFFTFILIKLILFSNPFFFFIHLGHLFRTKPDHLIFPLQFMFTHHSFSCLFRRGLFWFWHNGNYNYLDRIHIQRILYVFYIHAIIFLFFPFSPSI
jgi:hypothetical protein